jgi:hypothetical protein
MRKQLASLAVLAVAVACVGTAGAQTIRGQFSFEAVGEPVRPAELPKGQAPKAVGDAYHPYYYNNCYNYYRWYYDRWYGWQRYFVGTRCY